MINRIPILTVINHLQYLLEAAVAYFEVGFLFQHLPRVTEASHEKKLRIADLQVQYIILGPPKHETGVITI
jgi:hypothetical protein